MVAVLKSISSVNPCRNVQQCPSTRVVLKANSQTKASEFTWKHSELNDKIWNTMVDLLEFLLWNVVVMVTLVSFYISASAWNFIYRSSRSELFC